MPHLFYSVLANLSEAPDRRLRMTDLAETLKITRSRLTYAVSLPKAGRAGAPGGLPLGQAQQHRRADGRGHGRTGAYGARARRDRARDPLRPAHAGAGGAAGGDLHGDRARPAGRGRRSPDGGGALAAPFVLFRPRFPGRMETDCFNF